MEEPKFCPMCSKIMGSEVWHTEGFHVTYSPTNVIKIRPW